MIRSVCWATPVDFRAQLCLALQAQLSSDDGPLLEYLVESLDDDGYLRCSVEEAAHLFRVPLERVEHVLAALQAQDPAGIGARTVRECLLLQLQALAEQGIQQPSAFEILDQYLPWLGQHKYPEIARAVGCTARPGGAGAGLSPAPPASLSDAQRPGEHPATAQIAAP